MASGPSRTNANDRPVANRPIALVEPTESHGQARIHVQGSGTAADLADDYQMTDHVGARARRGATLPSICPRDGEPVDSGAGRLRVERIEFSLVDRVRLGLGLPRSDAVGAWNDRDGEGDDAPEAMRGLSRNAAIASVSRAAMFAMTVREAGSRLGDDGLDGPWLGEPLTGCR